MGFENFPNFQNFHNRLWFVRIKNELVFKIPKQVENYLKLKNKTEYE